MKTIELTKGFVTIVDDSDNEMLQAFRWYAAVHRGRRPGLGKYVYAASKMDGAMIYMHRFLLGASKGEEVVHLNQDRLDNRRCNLLLTNRTGVQRCSSPARGKKHTTFRGVSLQSGGRTKPWKATIMFRGRSVYLGSFATAEEAARVYDMAALFFGGEHARTNEYMNNG